MFVARVGNRPQPVQRVDDGLLSWFIVHGKIFLTLMASGAQVTTNVDSIPGVQATNEGKTTTFTQTGTAPVRGLVTEPTTLQPNTELVGSFKNLTVDGSGVAGKQKITFEPGGAALRTAMSAGKSKVKNASLILGEQTFKDKIIFDKGVKAKKVTIANFDDGDKLKYRGKTFTTNNIDSAAAAKLLKGFDFV